MNELSFQEMHLLLGPHHYIAILGPETEDKLYSTAGIYQQWWWL